MTATRKQAREAFGVLLAGITAASITYDYPAADFAGRTPVITLASSGTSREPLTAANTPIGLRAQRIGYDLDVYVFVLYAEVNKETGAVTWYEADAVDTLDALEQAVADIVVANQNAANWQGITYRGGSTIDVENIGGDAYMRELIQLRFAEFSG